MKKIIIAVAAMLSVSVVSAQEKSKVNITGYAEMYYGFDFNKPASNSRPGFVYSHNRHNEVNLNLGFIKANYDNGIVRTNLALMAGTYANANLAAEPGVLKNVFEANAGIRISRTSNLWVDAGIFSSHIGFEGAISKDCWVLTRNISSENTPYYEAGAKVTFISDDNKWTIAGLYLNGWQRIQRLDGNSRPAGGLQLNWKPLENLTLNYSNYLGSEGADSVSVTRFYHNLYGIYQLNDAVGIILGVDYGTQQKFKGSSTKKKVFSPVAMARYTFHPKWALAGRLEYYQDKEGMIISSETAHGFQTKGYSINIDYLPVTNAVLRLEAKVYDSKDKIFERGADMVNYNNAVTASLAVSF